MDRFKVTAEDADGRIDRFLALRQSGLTRSGLERLFDAGKILVNGKSKPKNYKLCTNDEIVLLDGEKAVEINVKAQNITLEIPYEDEHLLVVNKPKGMAAHPSSQGEDGTLVNALLYHCGDKLSSVGEAFRPGIVHRIDKDTSGLLVVAKTNEAHESLKKQAAEHTMLRRYEGVVYGSLKDDAGVIDAPIGRHPVRRTKNCVCDNGRHAVTRYFVLRRYNGFTHAGFELETGRMHQIRVHLAYIGHPLAGDALYGPPKPIKSLKGQCLHAGTLGFIHPATGERLEFSAMPPPCFTDFLNMLELEDNW